MPFGIDWPIIRHIVCSCIPDRSMSVDECVDGSSPSVRRTSTAPPPAHGPA